jgi:phage tail-like protein
MPNLLPLSSFNFTVETIIYKGAWICTSGFAECDGLEMTMEPKTIREGGNNARPIHLPGKVSYGQLTLRRGMTTSRELWTWFDLAHESVALTKSRLRADSMIQVQSSDRSQSVRYLLTNCQPVRLKAPSMDALRGAIAIEEMQLAYEWLFRI